MKNDLFTSIVVAIFGVVAAFLICNILIGNIEATSVKTVDSSFSIDIPEPNIEVFNYKAINPTVEVYVGNNGDCSSRDSEGNCIYNGTQNEPESPSDQGNE